MYDMVTAANNICIAYLKVGNRVDLKSRHKKKIFVTMVVVIIAQCIPISSHHYVETNVSIIPQQKLVKVSCYLNVCKNYLL